MRPWGASWGGGTVAGEVFVATNVSGAPPSLAGAPHNGAINEGAYALKNPAASGKRIVPLWTRVMGDSSGAVSGGKVQISLDVLAGTGGILEGPAPTFAAPTFAAPTGCSGAVALVSTDATRVLPGSGSRLIGAGRLLSRGSGLGAELVLDFSRVCSASGIYLAEGAILSVRCYPGGSEGIYTEIAWAEVAA